jgi:hypothetical protein
MTSGFVLLKAINQLFTSGSCQPELIMSAGRRRSSSSATMHPCLSSSIGILLVNDQQVPIGLFSFGPFVDLTWKGTNEPGEVAGGAVKVRAVASPSVIDVSARKHFQLSDAS